MATPKISVIIPAFNEERAIGRVLEEIPSTVSEVIVVDNGSTDATAAIARLRGAVVVHEPTRGYGQACLRGLSALSDTDIVVFLDGEYFCNFSHSPFRDAVGIRTSGTGRVMSDLESPRSGNQFT